MTERYAKQTILPEIGAQGQRRLSDSSVLCVGAGGLGCASLPYLAAAGVGRIVVVDDDRVELSNLQRQTLFTETDIGRPKAQVAANRLASMNREVEVVPVAQRLDLDNVQTLVTAADVIIDGSDNYATKYLVADASVKFGVPLVYGSATGMEAMVTVFVPGHGPCLRCLFPHAPSGWVPNCDQAGVLGPLVGMAGCIQAAEAIKLLTGAESLSNLTGRLWMIDARDMSSRQLAVQVRENCPACSGPPGDIELTGTGGRAVSISVSEAQSLADAVWIDVREPDEFQAGHIDRAINLPLSRMRGGDFQPPGNGPAIVYCATGMRCQAAIALLRQAGVTTVYSLEGGLAAWQQHCR